MKALRFAAVIGLGTVLILSASSTARAQSVTGLQVPTPGARANAMGGTFIAIADDGSASIANPAGLMSLTRPQIYAEFTSTKTSTAEGLSSAPQETRVNFPSFFSVSIPVGSRVAIGATVNEFFNFSDKSSGNYITWFTGGGYVNTRLYGPYSFDASEHGHSYGGSIAVAVSPRLRLGATITADHFVENDQASGDFPPFYSSSFVSNDWAKGITVGGLWQKSEKVALGFVAAHEVGTQHAGPPTRIGGGLAVRASSRLLTSADIVWIGSGLNTTELHVGGEYSMPQSSGQLLLRAGGFVSANDSTGKDRGVSVGAGYAAGQHFQMDFAYVTQHNRVVLSAGIRL